MYARVRIKRECVFGVRVKRECVLGLGLRGMRVRALRLAYLDDLGETRLTER